MAVWAGDLGEEHFFILLVGLAIQSGMDVFRREAKVEEFADEQGLQVMAEAVDGAAPVFIGSVQAAEGLVVAERAHGEVIAHALVATFIRLRIKSTHGAVHPVHEIVHGELGIHPLDLFKLCGRDGGNVE